MHSPSDRCGFEYAGERGNEYCCYRSAWRDTGRCVWHAEIEDDEGKPDDALLAARVDPGRRRGESGPTELLDGADLAHENLPGGLDLAGVSLRDADLTDTDLRGVDLSGADLRDSSFRDADLRDADLSGAACWDAVFADGYLAGADLSGANLREADLADATLAGADLSGGNLEGAFLDRANLFDADLTGVRAYGAVLASARANEGTVLDDRCVYDPMAETGGDSGATDTGDGDTGEGPDPLTKAVATYQELEKLCAENAMLSAQSRYFVRRQDIHTRDHRDEGRWGRWLRARVSRAVVLYGESPFRVLGTASAVVVLSALVYPLGYLQDGATGDPVTYPPPTDPVAFLGTLANSLYFSTLAFTTMTFGHYVPVGLGKFLAMFETAAGVVLIALLVFVFGRRATR